MKPDHFIKTASRPESWRAKAVSHRLCADLIWEEFFRQLPKAIKNMSSPEFSAAHNLLRNAQFLYSLSVECSLKGIIVKQDPTAVIFETSVDANGNIVEAKIKQIGKTRIDTHNLEKLAEIAGMVEKDGDPEIRELLEFSTFCILWIGRYPVPLDTNSTFAQRGKLPTIVFSHYYRDLMDPFLDKVLAVLKD